MFYDDYDDSWLECLPKIKIIGIGGSGIRIVNQMLHHGLAGVEFIVMDTDSQELRDSIAPKRITLGENLANELPLCDDSDVGKRVAQESQEDIIEALEGSDIVFIITGAGSEIATGAAPIIASYAHEKCPLTIAMVISQFNSVGKICHQSATNGWEELKRNVDVIITNPCDIFGDTKEELLSVADDLISQYFEAFIDVVSVPEEINIDFEDMISLLSNSGEALMNIGNAAGADAIMEASRKAVEPISIQKRLKDVQTILLSISGASIGMGELYNITSFIKELTQPETDIIYKITNCDSMGDDISITIILMGTEKLQTLILQQ